MYYMYVIVTVNMVVLYECTSCGLQISSEYNFCAAHNHHSQCTIQVSAWVRQLLIHGN